MTNPTTPFSWQMPTASDLVTDLPADFETFGQAVATSMADLLGGTTGQVLSKASNTDMDFTWVSQDDSNAIQNAIVDAKGDLIVGASADTPARLAVGTNGHILTANSSATNGVEWAAPAAGGGLTLISTTTFSGSSIVLSSISGSYKNLHLEFTGVYNNTTYPAVGVRFNADTGSNYDYAAQGSQNTSGDLVNVGSQTEFYIISGTSNSGASEKASGVLDVFNYAQTTTPIIYTSQARVKQDVNWKSRVVTGQYRQSAALTSITFFDTGGNFSGGTIRLYGAN